MNVSTSATDTAVAARADDMGQLENYAQELGAATSLLELLAYSIESDEKFFSYRLDSALHTSIAQCIV